MRSIKNGFKVASSMYKEMYDDFKALPKRDKAIVIGSTAVGTVVGVTAGAKVASAVGGGLIVKTVVGYATFCAAGSAASVATTAAATYIDHKYINKSVTVK